MSTPRKKLVIAGVMTGTSCDGLDVAALEFNANGWTPLWEATAAYPSALRAQVLAVQDPDYQGSLKDTFALHRDLGIWYGNTISKILKGQKKPQQPHVIANHGQTVGHYPADRKGGYTIQMGDPAQISAITGLTVVSHFRNGDMADGGEGAPLAPVFHHLLSKFLPERRKGVAIHNLGGISNFTYLAPDGKIFACDTGPANVFMDGATEKVTHGKMKLDRDGRLAEAGEVDTKALKKLLQHSFFKRPLPKSTGRDDFTLPWFFEMTKKVPAKNLVATATALTAESIGRTYRKFLTKKRPLHTIYFTGGGTLNPILMGWISQRLRGVEVKTLDEAGFDSRFIEAQAFAYMGFLSLTGQPLGGPWTGVELEKKSAPPGWITPGKNWNDVLKRLP